MGSLFIASYLNTSVNFLSDIDWLETALFTHSIYQLIQLELSLNSKFKTFEDAVQYYSGKCFSVCGLVTRNTKDYKQAKSPIYTPDELWGIISIN